MSGSVCFVYSAPGGRAAAPISGVNLWVACASDPIDIIVICASLHVILCSPNVEEAKMLCHLRTSLRFDERFQCPVPCAYHNIHIVHFPVRPLSWARMDNGKQRSRAILSNHIAIGIMGKHLLEREDLGHLNRHSVPLRRGKVMSRKAAPWSEF